MALTLSEAAKDPRRPAFYILKLGPLALPRCPLHRPLPRRLARFLGHSKDFCVAD